MRARVLLLLSSLAALSCAERCSHQSAPGEVLLTADPKPGHPLQVTFEDDVELLGYDLDSAQLAPGQPFTITWYYRVRAPLGEGAQLFTHVADARGQTLLNVDAERPLRRIYPESRWRAGDRIRDVQTLTLPSDWSSPSAVFYLGFYSGERRWKVTRGVADAENRAEAARVPVAIGQAAPLPELKAAKLQGAIALDGKLDEPAWQSAQDSGPLVQTFTGGPAEFRATVRVLYDAQQIYVGFEVDDDVLKSSFQNTDDHLWEQDTIEVMFDPEGDGQNYFELQVSPRGAHFDTRYDSRRKPRPFGHVDWDSKVQAGVQVRGTIDDAAADSGYTVELAVPWSAFAAGETPAVPPQAGGSWRINFFVMDARENGQRAAAWSPPRVGDFHTLERFGIVRFTE